MHHALLMIEKSLLVIFCVILKLKVSLVYYSYGDKLNRRRFTLMVIVIFSPLVPQWNEHSRSQYKYTVEQYKYTVELLYYDQQQIEIF